MISYIEGMLVEKHPTRVIVDVGGMGYEVGISLSSYDRLPRVSEKCRLLIYEHLREDSHDLVGFVTEDERSMFVMLLGISGVGPKTALGALSGMTVREIRAAVVEGDVKRLSSISGIGRKTAERIVLELRHRISAGDALESVSGAGAMTADEITTRDSVMALIALGHKREAALKMVAAVIKAAPKRDLTVEQVIKFALGGPRVGGALKEGLESDD